MPPKNKPKTLKAIAAEEKKKNAEKAKEIVAQLKRDMGKSDSNLTVDGTDSVENPSPKKKIKKVIAAESKKKNAVKAKNIVEKLKIISQKKDNVQDMSSKSKTAPTATVTTSFLSSEISKTGGGSIINLVETDISEMVEPVEMLPKVSTSPVTAPAEIVASSSKIPNFVNSASKVKKSTLSMKTGSSNTFAYQYEIDCKKVADSIDVIDLQRHLEEHLKVDGEKNNLNGTVWIRCEGQKVVIKSKTFFPKKSLRFLSKKFLKRNWNIQVVSKNVHSYEFKYVGTL